MKYSAAVANAFGHHKPNSSEQVAQIEDSRRRCAEFATFIESLPAGREKQVAMTNFETVSFWANAAIARAWGPAEPIVETETPQ